MLAVKVDPKKLRKEKPDTVRSELWQSAMSLAPSATNKDLMHEVEAAQIVCRSSNPEIHNAARDVEQGRQLKAPHRKKLKQLFAQEPDVSLALQRKFRQAANKQTYELIAIPSPSTAERRTGGAT